MNLHILLITSLMSGLFSMPDKLQQIFDTHRMGGTILIVDDKSGERMGHHPQLWDSGYLPASTFKIPNSIIGLETGVIDTAYLFPWNGEQRRLSQWNKVMNLREAFRVSCVPCYQELARKIGTERMQYYLKQFGYGQMVVTPETVDLFWLEGESRISPAGQVSFLQQLYHGRLPIKASTLQIMKEIMLNEKGEDFVLSAKTGWAVRNGNNYGWFVGWLESRGKVYFFATLVEPLKRDDLTDFASSRKAITLESFRALGLIR